MLPHIWVAGIFFTIFNGTYYKNSKHVCIFLMAVRLIHYIAIGVPTHMAPYIGDFFVVYFSFIVTQVGMDKAVLHSFRWLLLFTYNHFYTLQHTPLLLPWAFAGDIVTIIKMVRNDSLYMRLFNTGSFVIVRVLALAMLAFMYAQSSLRRWMFLITLMSETYIFWSMLNEVLPAKKHEKKD